MRTDQWLQPEKLQLNQPWDKHAMLLIYYVGNGCRVILVFVTMIESYQDSVLNGVTHPCLWDGSKRMAEEWFNHLKIRAQPQRKQVLHLVKQCKGAMGQMSFQKASNCWIYYLVGSCSDFSSCKKYESTLFCPAHVVTEIRISMTIFWIILGVRKLKKMLLIMSWMFVLVLRICYNWRKFTHLAFLSYRNQVSYR